MDAFLATYTRIWMLVEPLIVLFAAFVFFHDPVRRWNFFGYRPTAVMGAFDPQRGTVLLSRINGAWSFNQGGMYEENIYLTVLGVLKRELGLDETRWKLSYTRPLGRLRITNKTLINRARISTISVVGSLRGKGYMGCLIRMRMDGIEADVRPGAGVEQIRVVDLATARSLVTQTDELTTDEHAPKKQRMILDMIDEIEAYSKSIRSYESRRVVLEGASGEGEKGEGEKGEKGETE